MKFRLPFLLILSYFMISTVVMGQKTSGNKDIDDKVRKFLDEQRGKWFDLNVPEVDGQTLFNLIVEGNYKDALEIGTSTGHSGVWIAWALSKTGGRLTTIEIDPERHKEAVENFKKAGLSEFVDARLGDAHQLVRELKGPFDFVFSDADKDWYKNYFVDVDPKLKVGGCFTAHNVYEGRRGSVRSGQQEYLEYVKSLPNYRTSVNSQGGGIAISYKLSEK